ncbi:DUF4189 domain-containing protein [Sphingobium sp. BHU LFT2]|uniref:DUF4189 domain-containing protein n=1 Tax=Sphingobium sp. BHU LFT2 TaxID=2807634 RepID=UPI001BEB1FEB|nr:DUF4189 domain-containing protein [Sphingobium sp. BHU LFT2]MBT2245822.1 DUF4189 domain-containing protein [Sphingobium sp. BHU LFT2]
MKRLVPALLLLQPFSPVAILAAAPAAAQTACPGGVSPGDPRCGPGGGNGLWTAPPEYQPRWRYKNRFGAYAFGFTKEGRVLGIATGRKTRGGAEKAAIEHCQAQGGSDCQMIVWFGNNCSALAYPVDKGAYTYFDSDGGSERDAATKAVRACASKSGVPCVPLAAFCAGTEWVFG